MKYAVKQGKLLLLLVPALLFAVSCDIFESDSDDDDQQVESREVTVTMQLEPLTTPAVNPESSAPAKQAVTSLTEVKLLVDELELENVNDDSLDFEVNDLIVNLPVDGSIIEVSTAEVPVGTYDEFEMEIEFDDDTTVSDPDFFSDTGDDDDGYSIVVRGVYNGEEFLFRSDEDFELELDFNPPLVVSESSSPTVEILIDPSGWFLDRAGNDLDPTNPANFDQINDNIEISFEVASDDD